MTSSSGISTTVQFVQFLEKDNNPTDEEVTECEHLFINTVNISAQGQVFRGVRTDPQRDWVAMATAKQARGRGGVTLPWQRLNNPEEEKKMRMMKMKQVDSDEEEGQEEGFEEVLREASSSSSSSSPPNRLRPKLHPLPDIPAVVDDFVRNFLHRCGLVRTLRSFEAEWYGAVTKTPPTGSVPDARTQNQLLQSELEAVQKDAERLRRGLMEAEQSTDQMRTEAEFHRLQHRRAATHKRQLIAEFKELREHHDAYEPVLRHLGEKYEVALRQKAVLSLVTEPVQKKTHENQMHSRQQMASHDTVGSGRKVSSSTRLQNQDYHMYSHRPRPHLAEVSADRTSTPFYLSCSIRAHQLPVSCIRLHPQKPLLASTSDDRTWRLWTVPSAGQGAEGLRTTAGCSDWLSSCTFHPDGTKLATTSGDCTVRLWDVPQCRCLLVLPGHLGPTWSCWFHSCGHFLASCSSDRTIKLWDLNSRCCHLTLRRHAATVSAVHFLPSSNLLLSCSADRTVALWDARLGVCTTTFMGHQHPCNHIAFHPTGDIIASCDSGGVVSLWDVRKPASVRVTMETGASANQVAFSPTGRTLAVAGGDGQVHLLEAASCTTVSQSGHRDSVQSVTFDLQGETLMSAGQDGIINVWRHERQEQIHVKQF